MENLDQIQQSIMTPMTALWTKVAAFAPNLVSAVIILVAGYFIARVLKFAINKVLQRMGVDKLSKKAGVPAMLKASGVKMAASELMGEVIFWLILLTFVVSAADTLGLPRVSSTVDDFVLYLPKVIGAALVVLVGLFVAKFIRGAVQSLGEGMNLEYAKGLGTVIHTLLLIVIASLAIGQLEIETALLNTVVSIVLVAIGAAIALSLGLGTRDVSANIIAGVYARDLFKPGMSLTIGDVKGEVVEVGTAKTTILAGKGQAVTVSNRDLLEQMVESFEPTQKAA